MGLFNKGKKKNWMIVLHRFHVNSRGFRHEILCDATQAEADAYATIKADEWEGGDIPTVAGRAIELPDCVHVIHQKPIEQLGTSA